MNDKLAWLRKSWTIYLAAFVMASPEIMAFLPIIKVYIPADWYPWMIRVAGAAFIVLRIKTQVQK